MRHIEFASSLKTSALLKWNIRHAIFFMLLNYSEYYLNTPAEGLLFVKANCFELITR